MDKKIRNSAAIFVGGAASWVVANRTIALIEKMKSKRGSKLANVALVKKAKRTGRKSFKNFF